MGGWDQLRSRLVGDDDGNAMIVFFNTSRDIIRTLPALQHDLQRPEDCDTESEDHAADSVRYACSSRPYVKEAPKTVVRDSWAKAFDRASSQPVEDWRVA